VSASFAIKCPYCGKSTRAPAEALYRWRLDGKGRSAADLGNLTRDLREIEAEFGSHCPECGDPLALRISGPASLFAQVSSGALKAIELEHREQDLKLVRCFPAWKAKTKPELAPVVPTKVRDLLPMLREDAAKGHNLAGVLAGAGKCLDDLVTALETANPPRGINWWGRSAPDDYGRRLQALVKAGALTAPVASSGRRYAEAPTHTLAATRVEACLGLIEAVIQVGFEAPYRLHNPVKTGTAKVDGLLPALTQH
jgi:hypothetical protein